MSVCRWPFESSVVRLDVQVRACSWRWRDAPVLKLMQEDTSVARQSWQVLNALILMSYPNFQAIWIKFSLNYHNIPATSGGMVPPSPHLFFFYWNLILKERKKSG